MPTPQPTARLLYRALRRFEHALQERIEAAGYDDVTVGHMNLLRHLDAEGMRMSLLAEHAGVTKQAVTQGVKALAARELVQVVPDPTDGRAKRVIYTPRGRMLVAESLGHVLELERSWAELLGDEAYLSLRASLVTLNDQPL